MSSLIVDVRLEGFGDLPQHLARFAVSLPGRPGRCLKPVLRPHWTGEAMPKPFGEMRKECSELDMETLASKGASSRQAPKGSIRDSTRCS